MSGEGQGVNNNENVLYMYMTSSQNRHIFLNMPILNSHDKKELRPFSESAESLRHRPLLLEA